MKKYIISLMALIAIFNSVQGQHSLQQKLKLYLPMNSAKFTDWGPYSITGQYNNVSLSDDNRRIADFGYLFNGTNSHLTWQSNDSLKIQFPITISTWIYLDDSSSYNPIFSSDVSSTNYSGFWLSCNLGKLQISYGNNNGAGTQYRRTFEANMMLPSKKWFHVAVVIRNLNTAFMYINQTLVTNTISGSSITKPFYSNENGYVGYSKNYFGSQDFYLKGKLAGLGIWNKELTELERKQSAHLTLWYDIENEINDKTRYQNNGNGKNVTYSKNRNNIAFSALKLSGSNSWVQLPPNNSYKNNLPLTISLWLRIDSSYTFSNVLNVCDNFTNKYTGFSLDVNNSILSATFGSNNGIGVAHRKSFIAYMDTLQLNSWYYVVAECYNSFGLDSVALWINGVRALGYYDGNMSSIVGFESNRSGYLGFQTNPFGVDKAFKGMIDQLQIYDARMGSILNSDQWSPSLYVEEHPQSSLINKNDNFELNCVAIGNGKLQYQWQKFISGNWQNIGTNAKNLKFSSFTINDTGSYRCVVKNYNLTVYTEIANLKLNTSTSIIDVIAYDSIILYPNPASDVIYVEHLSQNSVFEVYNSVGVKVDVLVDGNTIDIKSLSNGIYFFKIKFDSTYKVLSFIKE